VIADQASGHGERYLHMGSATSSFPLSASSRIEIAVNGFVTDPIRKRVWGVLGVLAASSA
jgi:hypothetical protein